LSNKLVNYFNHLPFIIQLYMYQKCCLYSI
jgi:hypothetical protein